MIYDHKMIKDFIQSNIKYSRFGSFDLEDLVQESLYRIYIISQKSPDKLKCPNFIKKSIKNTVLNYIGRNQCHISISSRSYFRHRKHISEIMSIVATKIEKETIKNTLEVSSCPSEKIVYNLLSDGYNLTDIAKKSGLSLYLIKKILKEIYLKNAGT